MERRSSPVADRRALTTALRRLREASGLSLDEAASQALDASAAKLSRMETGRQSPSPRDVRDLCRLYAVDADRTDHLISLARSAKEEGWWESYEYEMDDYIGLETAATVIHEFQNTLIPGILQTRQYAERYMTGVINPTRARPRTRVEIDRWLDMRDQRQLILSSDSGVELHFALDEAVLRRAGATLPGQVAHLRDVARSPNVHLGIIPLRLGDYPGTPSGFIILTLPDEVPDVAYVETPAGYFTLEAVTEVRRFRTLYSQIANACTQGDATLALLDQIHADVSARSS